MNCFDKPDSQNAEMAPVLFSPEQFRAGLALQPEVVALLDTNPPANLCDRVMSKIRATGLETRSCEIQ